MSWLSDIINKLWTKDTLKVIIDLIRRLVIAFAGQVGGEVYKIVREEVKNAENSNEESNVKWKIAYTAILARIKEKNFPNSLVRLFIELAVQEIDTRIVKDPNA